MAVYSLQVRQIKVVSQNDRKLCSDLLAALQDITKILNNHDYDFATKKILSISRIKSLIEELNSKIIKSGKTSKYNIKRTYTAEFNRSERAFSLCDSKTMCTIYCTDILDPVCRVMVLPNK